MPQRHCQRCCQVVDACRHQAAAQLQQQRTLYCSWPVIGGEREASPIGAAISVQCPCTRGINYALTVGWVGGWAGRWVVMVGGGVTRAFLDVHRNAPVPHTGTACTAAPLPYLGKGALHIVSNTAQQLVCARVLIDKRRHTSKR